MRRRDRIILFLIGLIAFGTFAFAILQFAGMRRGSELERDKPKQGPPPNH